MIVDRDRRNDARILVVDDETRVLQAIMTVLDEDGFYTVATPDPAEALGLVGQREFDIVFLDQFVGSARGLDLMDEMAALRPGQSYVIITGNGSPALAVEALKRGASDFISKPFSAAEILKSVDYVSKKRIFDRERREFLFTLERKVEEKTRELDAITFSVLLSLAQAIEKKDIGTFGHSKRVSCYASLIAAELGLEERERRDIRVASLFHDIGKIGISDFILGKQGPLDRNETDVVRNHPQAGLEILRPISQFDPVLPGVLHHHEAYDGRGYPAGLRGEEIPLMARVIAVADALDAIISSRPYRAAAGYGRALHEFTTNAGTQFDPRIVDALFSAVNRDRQGFERLTALPHGPLAHHDPLHALFIGLPGPPGMNI